jgi:hypothetical protein
MKNHFRPVAILALLTLVVTGGVVAQTTYDLPTGKTLTVINQLPEALRSHFNVEALAGLLSDLRPAFNYRLFTNITVTSTVITLMISDYVPDPPPMDPSGTPFVPAPNGLLPTLFIEQYMLYLYIWYMSALDSMPADVRRGLMIHPIRYTVFLRNRGQQIGFVTQPIGYDTVPQIAEPLYVVEDSGELVEVWGDVSGQFDSLQMAHDEGFFPIGVPVDPATGERNTSWLVYEFFDALPEK